MNGTRVKIDTDTEGPRYDPYHVDIITVTRLGHEAVLRSGLGVRLWIDDVEYDCSEEDCIRAFEACTGMGPGEAEHWHCKARNICPKCFCKKVIPLGSGYAGETMYGCARCGTVMYDDFHMSMIE